MQQSEDNYDISLELIKKKPKILEVLNNKQTKSTQTIKNQSAEIPIQYVPVKKVQAQLLESLNIIENIKPNAMQSSLKSDYTEWTHQDFMFLLDLQSGLIHNDCIVGLNQYFWDFNQKCQIYPYIHYIDLKPDNDNLININPPYEQQKVEFNENIIRPRQIPIVQLLKK